MNRNLFLGLFIVFILGLGACSSGAAPVETPQPEGGSETLDTPSATSTPEPTLPPPTITPTFTYPIDFEAYEMPLGGEAVESFEVFDEMVINHMQELTINAGVLVIARGGEIEYERSYGYIDQGDTYPLQPNNLFRIASISKPITLATLTELIRKGQLPYNT